MTNKVKFPQLAELPVGHSLFVPLTDETNIGTLRVTAYNSGLRLGRKFSVHVDRKDKTIEIARVDNKPTAAIEGRTGPSTRRTHIMSLSSKERSALLTEALARDEAGG